MREKIKNILDKQRAFFATHQTKDIDFRIAKLQILKKTIEKYKDKIVDAGIADLRRSKAEFLRKEFLRPYHEIDYIIKNIKTWTRPQKVKTKFMNFPAKSMIYSDPLGINLNIAPWNYPFTLNLKPLMYSIAAGNCVVLKPSELSPKTSMVIADMIEEAFDENFVCVFQGGVEVAQALLAEKFDLIHFTGSSRVGRIVMQAAAKHLTPVVLELGGKNPCIVDKDVDIEVAARRVVWGKFMNVGQDCISPDYLCVHKDIKEQFVEQLKKTIIHFYTDHPQQSPDYGRVINEHHFDRLVGLLQGDFVSFGKSDKAEKFFPPTLITNADWNHQAMQEEVFGPILPIIEYLDISDVIKRINDMPKSLALYLFSNNDDIQKDVLSKTSSGGVCVNDTMKHVMSRYLPFGGVGQSGIGKDGFDAFCHKKSVMKRSFWFDIKKFYPPYE